MAIKNFKGFTLIELVMALGLVSLIAVVIMQAQKSALRSTNDLQVTGEVNNLYQMLSSELSRSETCNANFKGKTPAYVPTSIVNKSGVNLITANTPYGNEIDIQTITINVVGNVWNLRVNYIPHIKDPITKQNVTGRYFIIPLTVFLNGAGAVKSCFSDVQSLVEKAIEYACDTTSGVYVPGSGSTLGTCNSDFVVKGSDNTNSTLSSNTYLCPAGEFLQRVVSAGASPTLTFQCTSALSATPCGPWEYIKGFDSATGKAVCVDIRTLFATGSPGLMVIQAGVYKLIDLDCTSGGLYPTRILQSISASGALNCIDPKITQSCPVNYYLTGINYATQPATPICDKVTNDLPPPCAAGSYLISIDNIGNMVCKSGTLSCGSPSDYIYGTDASGNVLCAPMP